GYVPTELFGRIEFPVINDRPLFLTLGPHAFYWFELHPAERRERIEVSTAEPRAAIRAKALRELPGGALRAALDRAFPRYIVRQRVFRVKGRDIRDVDLFDLNTMDVAGSDAAMAIIRIEYAAGDPENYLVPLIRTRPERAAELKAEPILELRGADQDTAVI